MHSKDIFSVVSTPLSSQTAVGLTSGYTRNSRLRRSFGSSRTQTVRKAVDLASCLCCLDEHVRYVDFKDPGHSA